MSSNNDTTEPDESGAAMKNDTDMDSELQAIRTQMSALPNQIVGPTLETVHTYLEPLHASIRHLEGLVADQLDSIRNVVFEESSSAVQTEVVSLLRPAQDALSRVESQINANQDSLRKSVFEETSRAVQVESTQANERSQQSFKTLSEKLAHISETLPQTIFEKSSAAVQTEVGTIVQPLKQAVSGIEAHLLAFESASRPATFQEASRAVQIEASNLLEPIRLNLLQIAEQANNLAIALQSLAQLSRDNDVGLQFALIRQSGSGPNRLLDRKSHLRRLINRRPRALDLTTRNEKFDGLKKAYPDRYADWRECYDQGGEIYIESPKNNCAHWSERRAWAFQSYLRIHGRGNMLDIGCGPYGDPLYLRGIDRHWLTGLEPLTMQTETRFPVHMGFNEDIPFQDDAFDTVVNSTALDHCIDLLDAIAETARVTRSGGRFIAWYANVEGSKDPTGPYKGPIDQFHLFHIDESWFMPMMEQHFRVLDHVSAWAADGIQDVFAVFEPKK